MIFAEPVAEAVGGDDEKYFELFAALSVVGDVSDLIEAVGDEFVPQDRDIVGAKCAAVLFGIAAVFGQSYLNAIAFQHDAFNRAMLAPPARGGEAPHR